MSDPFWDTLLNGVVLGAKVLAGGFAGLVFLYFGAKVAGYGWHRGKQLVTRDFPPSKRKDRHG